METKMDLLTGSELIKLFFALSPNTKAEIIAAKLKRNMFIYQDAAYILQKNNTYLKTEITKDILFPKITKYLNLSMDAMDDKSIKELDEKFEKRKERLSFIKTQLSNKEVDTYLPQLKDELTRTDVVPDSDKMQIHYNNGYIDLKTNEFKQRDPSKLVVTYCIDRDYKKSTAEEREEICKHLLKIYPEDDFEYIKYCLAKCLMGDPSKDQDTLFLMGKGSTGKSFVMSLTQKALGSNDGKDGYVFQLQSSSFEANNPKRDKILNSFAARAHVLLCWVNEFSDKNIASDDFKNFCDGCVQTTKLYKDGTTQIILKCKLVATTNIIPKFKIDSGTVRRFLAYVHTCLFTENMDEVDESKRIYAKDKYLIDKLKDANLLDAWVDTLAEMCQNIYEGNLPPMTENFKNSTESVVCANDFIQDFIDGNLVITKNDKDRIGKMEMKALFESKNPDKHLSFPQLLGALKEKNIIYMPKYSHKNIQGCFVYVKIKDPIDDETEPKHFGDGFVEATEEGIDKSDKSVKSGPPAIIEPPVIRVKKPGKPQPNKNISKAKPIDDDLEEIKFDFNSI